MECIDSLADEIWILGGESCSVEACNDADESEITLDVVAPMILAEAEAEDVVSSHAETATHEAKGLMRNSKKLCCFIEKTRHNIWWSRILFVPLQYS